MSFVSLEYLVFLPVVGLVYWRLPHRAQNLFLTAASLVFYGWFSWQFVLLLLYSAVLDFANGLGIERWPARKGWFLLASVIGNLGLLGVFKYFDFFVGTVSAGLSALGVRHDPWLLHLVLPVGISFYTFQTLAYTTDVYRGRMKPCRDPLDFLLFVSFFPQLVAGPINRAALLLPQVQRPRVAALGDLRAGLSLLAWGAVQKVVFADTLRGFVDATFEQVSPSGPMIWAAAATSNVMMFADFAGYTNLARGSARLLGFELAENFRAPFLALTPTEWWTRWHISFYDWMRDYVFQPLVLTPWCRRWLVPYRNPPAWVHPARGIVGSMVLSGVWHGADWHFVLWGAFFAAVQLGYFAAGRGLPKRVRDWPYAAVVQRPAMLLWFSISGILFHESDLARIGWLLTRNPVGGTPAQWASAAVTVVMVLAAAAPMTAAWWLRERFGARLAAHPARPLVESVGWCAAGWLVFVFLRGADAEFEYVRF